MNETCKFCGKPIKVAIFRNENWCSDNCRKDLEFYNNLESKETK